MEQGQGIMGDSKFLCSEYEDKANLEKNETKSWERDHSYNTRKITTKGNTEGGNWNRNIHGIQGRLIIEYSKQRRLNGGKLS